MKLLFAAIFSMVFSISAFSQNQHDDISPVEKAGICEGYHIFWVALTARINKPASMRCSIGQIEQLRGRYGHNHIFKENSSAANRHLIRAFQVNDQQPFRVAQSICIEAGMSICKID
jgi:hypothetical protein